MTNQFKRDPEFTSIVLDSYMDVGRAGDLRAKFRNLMSDGCSHFILDFQQTQFVCSATLGLLVEIYSSVKARSGKVLLQNLGPQVEKLLCDTKILSLFASEVETDVNHPVVATYEAVQEHTNQELLFLSRVNSITHNILMTDDAAEVHRQILLGVVESLRPRSAVLLLLSEDTKHFNVAASDNISSAVIAQLNGMSLQDGTLESNSLTTRTVADFCQVAMPDSPVLNAAGMRAGIMQPICGSDTRLGLILLESPEPHSTYFGQCLPILSAFGNMCGMMLEKKQLLENVRLKNTELSKALDTVNRMQDTILESGKLAVVGALTRGLCHALNNKLVPILGYAQILGIAMSPGSPEADKLRIVETAAFDIKKILDNMHMLATGINMPFTNTDVSEVIDSCLQMQDYLFQENEIIVLRDYTQCDPVAHLHRERLVQAFLALFHRLAQMFQTCPGKHEVRITLGRTAEHLLVIIRDNGRVLPPEQLALLERPFDQGNPFENERLNFSIARSVIKDHQGLFEVDSSKELGGTRVTMYFPVTRPHSS